MVKRGKHRESVICWGTSRFRIFYPRLKRVPRPGRFGLSRRIDRENSILPTDRPETAESEQALENYRVTGALQTNLLSAVQEVRSRETGIEAKRQKRNTI